MQIQLIEKHNAVKVFFNVFFSSIFLYFLEKYFLFQRFILFIFFNFLPSLLLQVRDEEFYLHRSEDSEFSQKTGLRLYTASKLKKVCIQLLENRKYKYHQFTHRKECNGLLKIIEFPNRLTYSLFWLLCYIAT